MPHLILALFLFPLFASLPFFFFQAKNFKALAALLSLNSFLFLMLGYFNGGDLEINIPWVEALGIHFHLKIESLSIPFLFLTALIIPISLLSIPSLSIASPNLFYGFILVLQALLVGFFTADDLFLFTLFWESMLIPLYFIINLWGGPLKQTASLKFLIYMIAGSSLMIAAVLALYINGGETFDLKSLALTAELSPYAAWIAAVFFLAFSVKTPLFPFHGWLPDTYFTASTSGTILLSSLLSKAGIYGFFKIGITLFPTFIQMWSPLFIGLAMTGVFYGGLLAWRQRDYKRLIAYSSLSHVNFILVGVFIWNQTAQSGAILQAMNHGITIAALFLVSGWLESRIQTTEIGKCKGLAKYMPSLSWLTLFFILSSIALPGMNNFVGEILILFGLFQVHTWLSIVLCLSIILSVIYMLKFMQSVYFNEPSPFEPSWKDISWKEGLIAAPLIFMILNIGIYPMPFIQEIENALVQTIGDYKTP